jgi:hypothetical protein
MASPIWISGGCSVEKRADTMRGGIGIRGRRVAFAADRDERLAVAVDLPARLDGVERRQFHGFRGSRRLARLGGRGQLRALRKVHPKDSKGVEIFRIAILVGRRMGEVDADLVTLDDDCAAIEHILAYPPNGTREEVSPRTEEVLDEIVEPFHVEVEFLGTVPLDRVALFVRRPVAPKAGLAFRGRILLDDGNIETLPVGLASADEVTALLADGKADIDTHGVPEICRFDGISGHAPRLTEAPKVDSPLLRKHAIEIEPAP